MDFAVTRRACIALTSGLLAAAFPAFAHEVELEEIEITGRRINLLGEAVSASQGIVGQAEIEVRPLLRTGEILELVPGMVVTQHSGSGKANQYFLRGFNLDHGTDFASFVDAMPVNMRSHGHGQGYSDLNFVIPEVIRQVSYKKGPYYASIGDFSGAGAAEMTTADKLEEGTISLTLGEDAYQRLLLADSVETGGGDWLYAVEHQGYDGPWSDVEEGVDKYNMLLKHSRDIAGGKLRVGIMAYDNDWNSADQIPARAVDSGLIDALGSLDPTAGGNSSRYSLNASYQNTHWDVGAYVMRYRMNLWSNFTYFLDDATDGDQFEQVDARLITGGHAVFSDAITLAGLDVTHKLGMDWRNDDVSEVGLYRTRERQRIGSVRADELRETSVGVFYDSSVQLTERLRATVGLRYDWFDFSVDTLLPANSAGVNLTANNGSDDDGIVSVKSNISYRFNDNWEGYVSWGQGFHSNDARGVTITRDPGSGDAVEGVDPLVRSTGYEAGVRVFVGDRLNASVSVWALELDGELLFVGDAGNTEASGASERSGIELAAYFRLNDMLTLDLEYARADAEFSDAPAGEDAVPGAIDQVLQAGISLTMDNGIYGSLRLRHFGERALEESDSIRSDSSTVVNLRAGYRWDNITLQADVLNLLDSEDHDIDYYYESQLRGETAPVEDRHYHPLEPRTVRVMVSYHF
jgi:outer membrane receptor protein involved in Fe transport